MAQRKRAPAKKAASQDANYILVNKDFLAGLLGQNAGQQLGQLGTLTGNQMSGANTGMSSQSNLEDMSETETMKALMPTNLLNMKKILAGELGALFGYLTNNNIVAANAVLQSQLLNLNAINHANTINSGLADQFVKTIGGGGHDFRQLMAQPFLFTENAPAAQDTPGEGSDPGLKGGTKGGRRTVTSKRATRKR